MLRQGEARSGGDVSSAPSETEYQAPIMMMMTTLKQLISEIRYSLLNRTPGPSVVS